MKLLITMLALFSLISTKAGGSSPEGISTVENEGRNGLAGESSAYLLAHADNPVNWYPWCEEAFDLAREEDRPVFLSIGYSSCHWCHVMEEESFEDEDVAALLNEAFICIKVDREERPDIDNLYMRFAIAMTGGGGWPMTVIMTPDGNPFFAGTYIPKNTAFGRTGLMQLIPAIEEQWQTNRNDIATQALEIRNMVLQDRISPSLSDELPTGIIERAFSHFSGTYDIEYGGFGNAPKFPSPHNLLFLLRYWKATGQEQALNMACNTLRAIRSGGIFDQIGLGVHRYSTDREWLIPHFEKMMYDQAMLSIAFIEAYQATGDEYYAEVASEIFRYVMSEMSSTSGAFYSSEDADSEGGEGAYYTWTTEEASSVLSGDELEFAVRYWNLSGSGRRNIPHLSTNNSANLPWPSGNCESVIETIRQKLLIERMNRPAPLRDEKVLADWNGLMIASLARASVALDNPDYFDAADAAFDFIRNHMMENGSKLMHSYCSGNTDSEGFLDDYAFFIWGCLELYNASLQQQYLSTAIELQQYLDENFRDESGGGYFFTAMNSDPRIPRLKESYDGAVPSGNSVELQNLLTLWKLTGTTGYFESASGIESAFASQISSSPQSFGMMISGILYGNVGGTQVLLNGSRDDPDILEMLEVLRTGYRPWLTVSLYNPDGTAPVPPWIREIIPADGEVAAYVCHDGACSLPVSCSVDLLKQLD